MFVRSSKTTEQETRVACAVLTDELRLAQQLGVGATATQNCSITSTDALPLAQQVWVSATGTGSLCNSNIKTVLFTSTDALPLHLSCPCDPDWPPLTFSNITSHHCPPVKQFIHYYYTDMKYRMSSLGGTPSPSVYWGCTVQCILFIRGLLAVELTATDESTSFAVLIPDKKTFCSCVLGLFTNVNRLSILVGKVT